MKITILKSNLQSVLNDIQDKDAVVHLVAMNCNIEDIPDLSILPNLKMLDLSNNCIQEADNLPTQLIYLNLSFNQINLIQKVKLNPNLVSVNLTGNPISTRCNYRVNTIKQIRVICPLLEYLDNVPTGKRDIKIDENNVNFSEIMGYNFELLQ